MKIYKKEIWLVKGKLQKEITLTNLVNTLKLNNSKGVLIKEHYNRSDVNYYTLNYNLITQNEALKINKDIDTWV